MRGLSDADLLNTLSETPLRAVPETRSDGSRIPLFQMGPSSGAMSGDDLLRMIWDALGADQVTTKEATDRLEQAFGYRCPDDLAKTFMKFRKEGLIKGQISMDRGGWVWWVDDECRSRRSLRWRPTTRTRTSRPRGATCSPATSTAS